VAAARAGPAAGAAAAGAAAQATGAAAAAAAAAAAVMGGELLEEGRGRFVQRSSWLGCLSTKGVCVCGVKPEVASEVECTVNKWQKEIKPSLEPLVPM